jgi:hypothetical protein
MMLVVFLNRALILLRVRIMPWYSCLPAGRAIPDNTYVMCTSVPPACLQATFQLGVLYLLVFHGNDIFDVDNLTKNTMVFNTFVCMQLFNQVRCG